MIMATRADAIAIVREHFQSGQFLKELDRRVGYQTESLNADKADALRAYLVENLQPAFTDLDFTTRLIESPTGRGPYLIADYQEDTSRPTVLSYGHGDVVDGMVGEWRDGLNPWQTTVKGERVYGRGTADNKGQHSINMAALRAVKQARGGKLGFNAKFIIETGEEIGSPDLREVCEAHREELKADLFVASDGPRLSAGRPTIFLGCRGGNRIHLDVNLREGGNHSGNWGGVLANPATILVNAIASLVDGRGRMKLEILKPPPISNRVRAALADVKIEPSADEPQLAEDWGEEGLTAAERLYAWNTLEVLAMSSGNIDKPANAIPGKASAVLQDAAAAVELHPIFLLESELSLAAESFSVKFDDIAHRYVVLFGKDPFESLTIPRALIVKRLQQVLFNLTLRLRTLYANGRAREESLAAVIADTAAPLRRSAYAILELRGDGPSSPKAALESLAAEFGGNWAADLQNLSKAREDLHLEPGTAVNLILRLAELAESLRRLAAKLS